MLLQDEYLYHFTRREYLKWIFEDGYLKLTPSNLKEPKHMKQIIDDRGVTTVVDPTDSYKPVVWLTSDPTPKTSENGLYAEKNDVRITIKKDEHCHEWATWALRNVMKADWYKRFTKGCDHHTWWICTDVIPTSKFIKIEILNNDSEYEIYKF